MAGKKVVPLKLTHNINHKRKLSLAGFVLQIKFPIYHLNLITPDILKIRPKTGSTHQSNKRPFRANNRFRLTDEGCARKGSIPAAPCSLCLPSLILGHYARMAFSPGFKRCVLLH